jgi:competence protein ComEC
MSTAAPASPTRRYPLALCALSLAFIAGVFVASAGADGRAALPGLLLAPVYWRRDWRLAVLALGCVAAFNLGVWRYQATAFHDTPAQVAYYIGTSADVTGVVAGEPTAAGSGENIPVSVSSLIISGQAVHAVGLLLVHYTGSLPVAYGDLLDLRGSIVAPPVFAGFDYRAYLAGQGIHAVMDFPGLSILARNQGNPLEGLAFALREALRRCIAASLPPQEAALLTGILLGAPTRTLGTLTAPFVTAGMIHIVAISGLKVALVSGTVTLLCARLPLRLRWAPALAVVVAYTLLSGATPSGLRSALMWALALAALQTGRQAYVWVSLALVSAVLVGRTPLLLWDTGFQLSVMGTAGIVAGSTWFERRLHRLPAPFRESVATTLAAQIATAPVTASGFGQISLVGPLANGLLLPLLGPIMAVGGLGALAGTLVPPLGHLALLPVYPLLVVFIAAVRWLASLPLAALSLGQPSLTAILAYYLLLALGSALLARYGGAAAIPRPPHGAVGRMPPGLALGVLLLGLAAALTLDRPSSQAAFWVAGTTNGTMALLQNGSGSTILIDGGTDGRAVQSLIGAHLPFWQRDLSAVLLSASDPRHVEGLRGLTALYTIHLAADAGVIYPSATYAQWRAELRTSHVPRVVARTGLRLTLDRTSWIDVLQPPSLTLDEDPAPVAYRIRLGHAVVLVLNQPAALSDSPLLKAESACADAVLITGVVDPASTAYLLDDLRPSLLVLPAPATGTPSPSIAGPAPAGLVTRTIAPGQILELPLGMGRCYAAE